MFSKIVLVCHKKNAVLDSELDMGQWILCLKNEDKPQRQCCELRVLVTMIAGYSELRQQGKAGREGKHHDSKLAQTKLKRTRRVGQEMKRKRNKN